MYEMNCLAQPSTPESIAVVSKQLHKANLSARLRYLCLIFRLISAD
jgi:hypothetical protein